MRMWWWIFAGLLLLTACESEGININETDFKDYSKLPNVTISNVTKNISVVDNIEVIEVYTPEFNKSLNIGSFYVSDFGVEKSSNSNIINALRNVIEDYDVVAFQGIRDHSETVFQDFMREELPLYNYIISERIGRDSSKEQYAFIYKGFVLVDDFFVYDDYNDVFEREPFIAKFNVEGYEFIIIQIHVKSVDAQEEIKELQRVVDFTRGYFGINDIFIMGNLYADDPYYFDGSSLKDYNWIIGEGLDTLTGLSHGRFDVIIDTKNTDGLITKSEVDVYSNDRDLVQGVSSNYPVMMRIEI